MEKQTIDNSHNILSHITEKRQKYNVSKAIVDTIKNDPEKDEKNTMLTLQAIDDVNSRVYPILTEKIHKTISEMDTYYIPEDLNSYLSDNDLFNILN